MNHTGLHDSGIDPAQPELPAGRRVDELHGISTKSLGKLSAAIMSDFSDFKDA